MSEVRGSLMDIGGLSQGLRDIGRDLTYAVTAPLIAAAGGAVKLFSDFDAGMRNIAAISPDVANNFERVSHMAQSLGETLRDGPVAASQALYEVYSAGFGGTVESAMMIATQAAYTAEAGLSDLQTTANALVVSMNAYGASAEQAAYFSDVLTQTVAIGVGDMGGLVTSISSAIPGAVALGVSFDDLGSSLAFLTQNSFNWSRAATGLGNVFNKLITPSDAMRQVWRELGVDTGEQLIQTFGGLEGSLRAIYDIIGNDPERLRQLFPDDRGFRAIQTIFDNFERYGTVMRDFDATLNGATDRARQQQLQSFAAQIDLMTSAFQSLGITIGGQIAPILTPIINDITKFTLQLADTNPEIIKLSVGLLAVVAAVGPLTWVIGTLMTPFGLFAGALTTIATLAGTNFGGFGDRLHDELLKVFPSLPELENTIDQMMRIFGQTTERVTEERHGGTMTREVEIPFIERLRRSLEAGVPALGKALSDMFDDGVAWVINTGFPAIDDFTSGILNQLSVHFAGNWYGNYQGKDSPVYTGFRDLLNGGIGDAINSVGGWLEQHFPKLSASVQEFLKNFGSWVENEGAPTLGAMIGYAFGKLTVLIVDAVRSIFGGVGKENPVVAAFREGVEGGWSDAMIDAHIEQGTWAGDFGNKIVLAIVAALAIVSFTPISVALVGGIAKSLLTFVIGSVLAPVGLSLVNAIAGAMLGSAVSFTSWGAVLGAIGKGLLSATGIGISAFIQLGSSLIGLIGKGIVAVTNTDAFLLLGSPLGVVIAGVVAGLAIYSLIPEETRLSLAQGILDAITQPFLGHTIDYSLFEAGLGVSITDAVARVADALGIQHGFWELKESYENEIRTALNLGAEDATTAHIPKMQDVINTLVDVWEYNDGKGLGVVAGGLAEFLANVQLQWGYIEDSFVTGANNTKLAAEPGTKQIHDTVDTNLKAVNNSIKSAGDDIPVKLNYFRDNAVAGLLAIYEAIRPIIHKIIDEWNAMLALIGQEVNVNVNVGGNGGGSGAGGSGGSGGNKGGGTGGKGVIVGKVFSAPALPVHQAQAVGMQTNNITITTNDADKLLDDLRRRGIDLKKRA